MQPPRIRLEIRGIMAAVAVSALLLWVCRADLPPIIAAIFFIVGPALALTWKRYSDALAQPLNAKQVTTRKQKITLLLTSFTVAVTVIGLSDFAFLVGYFGYSVLMAEAGFGYRNVLLRHQYEVSQLLIGAMFGLIMALTVAYALRLLIWPIVEKPPAPATAPADE
jgi:hypothetical protein